MEVASAAVAAVEIMMVDHKEVHHMVAVPVGVPETLLHQVSMATPTLAVVAAVALSMDQAVLEEVV